MPEMNDFNHLAFFLNAVIHPHWRVENFTNAWALVERRANVGKSSEQIDVIQKSVAEYFRSRRITGADVIEDVFQIG